VKWEKTPVFASTPSSSQTNLGGDLYSNRRYELIDAMTSLHCLIKVANQPEPNLVLKDMTLKLKIRAIEAAKYF
jgi:hypothetical protein